MSLMPPEAQARLDEVLNSPARGRSRRDQTFEPARQHVRPKLVTKAAVAEVEAVDAVGTFEALVSDFGPDRQHERFAATAFNNAVAKICRDGVSVPVLFGHAQADAVSVLGAVPPDGWRIDAHGLHASGWIDTLDPVGAKVFRMLKPARCSGASGSAWSVVGSQAAPERTGSPFSKRLTACSNSASCPCQPTAERAPSERRQMTPCRPPVNY